MGFTLQSIQIEKKVSFKNRLEKQTIKTVWKQIFPFRFQVVTGM